MKSRLVKLSLAFSAVAFMAITMFPSQSQAEILNPDKVEVSAEYDVTVIAAKEKKVHTLWRCFFTLQDVE